jgi:hypothetical protein
VSDMLRPPVFHHRVRKPPSSGRPAQGKYSDAMEMADARPSRRTLSPLLPARPTDGASADGKAASNQFIIRIGGKAFFTDLHGIQSNRPQPRVEPESPFPRKLHAFIFPACPLSAKGMNGSCSGNTFTAVRYAFGNKTLFACPERNSLAS